MSSDFFKVATDIIMRIVRYFGINAVPRMFCSNIVQPTIDIGKGKWVTSPLIPATTYWIAPFDCEVFVYGGSATSLFLDDVFPLLFGQALCALPCSGAFIGESWTTTGSRVTTGTRAHASASITGEIGTPGSADTALTRAAYSETGTLTQTGTLTSSVATYLGVVGMSVSGWLLSEGETLLCDVDMYVRYRRVA